MSHLRAPHLAVPHLRGFSLRDRPRVHEPWTVVLAVLVYLVAVFLILQAIAPQAF